MRFRTGFPVAVAMVLVAGAAWADPTVTKLRLGQHADKVRLVLDADGPLPLAVTATEDGRAVIIELPGVAWRAAGGGGRPGGLIAGHAFTGDGVLVVETRRPARVAKAFRLPPDATYPYRLVVDVVPDVEAATATETVSINVAQAGPVGDWLNQEGGNPNLDRARRNMRSAPTPVTTPTAPAYPGRAPTGAVRNPVYVSPGRQPYGRPDPRPVQQGFDNRYGASGGYGSDGPRGHSGIYLAGGLGLGFQENPAFVGELFDAEGMVDDTAFAGYAAMGRAFRNNARVEAEFIFNTGDLEQLQVTKNGGITGLSTGTNQLENGSWSGFGVMVNGAYDFPISARIRPFAMAGIGLAFVSAGSLELSGGTAVADEIGQAFGFQIGGGLNIAVTDRLSVDAQYRYFATSEAELETVNGDAFDVDFQSHSFMVGARYRI